VNRWRTVWHLLRGHRHVQDGTDLEEAQRKHNREQRLLAEAIARRQVVDRAATQIRRAQQEHDFTSLVEETFMIGRR
jgi:hypothetical protein